MSSRGRETDSFSSVFTSSSSCVDRDSNHTAPFNLSDCLDGPTSFPCVEPAIWDVTQQHEILLQQQEWQFFLQETDPAILSDSTIWQYWRKENRPLSGGHVHECVCALHCSLNHSVTTPSLPTPA